QIGAALNLYGMDNNDAIIPTDGIMPHDIWYFSATVNLGHLLSEKYLPVPADGSHVFYCPSMEANGGMKPAYFGFIYESIPGMTPADQRGFDGWQQSGRIVNISYEFRGSVRESYSTSLKEAVTYNKMTQVANLALATDMISYG